MARRYNRCAGNPKGSKEDPERCIAEVAGRSYLFYQCSGKRGKGPNGEFCGIHAARIKRGIMPYVPRDEEITS